MRAHACRVYCCKLKMLTFAVFTSAANAAFIAVFSSISCNNEMTNFSPFSFGVMKTDKTVCMFVYYYSKFCHFYLLRIAFDYFNFPFTTLPISFSSKLQ